MPPPHSLPLQLTSFVGREPQIAEVKRLLGTSRLLTLTGAGGTGKTRLALQVANQVVADYPDGVFFVNLAPVTDRSLVVPTMAQILDIKEAAGQPLSETLKAYLQGKEMLLLLDNFEQVMGAAPTVVDLLLAAPDLKVIVTSREPLHVQGEQLYPVPALELPDPEQPSSIKELSQKEAVALFVERARSGRPDFELTEENSPAVAQICLRLDGLPLAIELAAARTRVLTPQSMLSRLESRLTLLTGGAHNLPARQQTLRNAIEWSYNLLEDREQLLFQRMSVFQGGSTLEAVEAICNNDGKQGVDVFEGVDSLVSKSLVERRQGRDGEPCFVMLETIHEYAREKLQESGEAGALGREHALYFMSLAEEAEPHLIGGRPQEWLDRLEEEHDNIRSALQWAIAASRAKGHEQNTAVGNAEIGLRTAGAIWRFWQVRGYLSEGRGYLQDLLSEITSADFAGQTTRMLTKSSAKALVAAGVLAWLQRDYSAARTALEQVVSIEGEAKHQENTASALKYLGNLSYEQDDYHNAQSLYERSLALYREIGDMRNVASCLNNLGLVAYMQGDYLAAHSLSQQSIAIHKEIGDLQGIAYALTVRGLASYLQGDYLSSRSYYEQCLALRKQIGDKNGTAWSLSNLGAVSLMEGDHSAASALHEQSLAIQKEVGDKQGIAVSLAGLGMSAIETGRPWKGAALLGASQALLGAIRARMDLEHRSLFEQAVVSTRSQLGEAFDEALQEGRTMSVEQAIAYALSDTSSIWPVSNAPRESKLATSHKQSHPNELSRREMEVLHLLVEGLTNEQIAKRLFLSTNTVRAHLYSIYSKLDVRNRGAAIRVANEHQLV